MKTKIIDMKKLADSSYQVIIDASVKTIYESTIIGAGVFVIAAITSMVLILTWGAIKATGGWSMHSGTSKMISDISTDKYFVSKI